MFCYLFRKHTSKQFHLVLLLGSVLLRQGSTPKHPFLKLQDSSVTHHSARKAATVKNKSCKNNPDGLFSAINRLSKPGYKCTCIEVCLQLAFELKEGLKIKSDAFLLL